ncbi:hypothetical protein SOPP22_11380 [Shewanella sp. OPT22]|nr:hypothetical protein SOPP22_11380 [Shewanella sp. OPT22]
MKKILSLICLLFLSGCVITSDLTYEGHDKGYIFMSYMIADSHYAGDYKLYFENEQGQTSLFFYRKAGAWGKTKRDFDSDNFNGAVLYHKLKPGKYKLTKFEIERGNQKIHFAISPFDFNVYDNKATYLGELKEFVGGTGFMEFNNQQKRDEKLVKEKLNISNLIVIPEVPSKHLLKPKKLTEVKLY